MRFFGQAYQYNSKTAILLFPKKFLPSGKKTSILASSKREHRRNHMRVFTSPRSMIWTDLLAAGIGLVFTGAVFAGPVAIAPGFDLFATPSGGTTFAPNPVGAGSVTLTGVPLLPSLGDTDTIVQRLAGLPGIGPIPIQLQELDLKSVAPVSLVGGGFADMYVRVNNLGFANNVVYDTLSPSLGILNVLSNDGVIGGGSYNSFFDVFADIILVTPGSDPNVAGNVLAHSVNEQFFCVDTPTNLPVGKSCSGTTTPLGRWSTTGRPDDAHNSTYMSGGFFAGVANLQTSQDACVPGYPPPSNVPGCKVFTEEEALLAAHGVIPGQTTPTPEPSTLLLLVGGMAAIVVLKRKA